MNQPTHHSDRAHQSGADVLRVYPVDEPINDPRFGNGLAFAVGELLTEFGYPSLHVGDVLDLQEALYDFLYERRFAGRCRLDHHPGTEATGEGRR